MKTIEDAFKEFTNREDIAIVMINQYVRHSCMLSIVCLGVLVLQPITQLAFASADSKHDPAFAEELSEGIEIC